VRPWIPAVAIATATFIPTPALAADLPEPPPIPVDDAMLTPPPPPPRTVASWSDAEKLIDARSTDLRIATDQVAVAEGQWRVALAALLPTINGSITFTHQFITRTSSQVAGLNPDGTPAFRTVSSPQSDIFQFGLTANVPIVNVRSIYALGTASTNEDAAKMSLADRRRTIVIGAASAALAVLTAGHVEELARVGLRSALERLELTRRRATLGVGTELDVVRAQQDVDSARKQVVTSRESLRQAREALGLTLGLTEGVGVELGADGLEAGLATRCHPVASIEERADVTAAALQANVARRARTDVWLQFLPSLSLTSAASTTTADVGAAPAGTWSLQALLSVPIWDGGARYGQLRIAEANADISLQNLEALRRSITIQRTQTDRAVTVATEARDVAQQARDHAAQVDRLTRIAYANGQGTSVDLVVAATALRQSDLDLAVSEFDLEQAKLSQKMQLVRCDR
jgi:outer membrane protein TolC